MRSMTGFSTSQIKDRNLELEIHVKSVNGRFLEVRFHLPKEYAPFETDLRRQFKTWGRGTVDVYVHRRLHAHLGVPQVGLRTDVARHWARELKKLAADLKVKSDITLRDILQMPQVIEISERPGLRQNEPELLNAQLAKAIRGCENVRLAEGRALKTELLNQLKALEKLARAMEKSRPAALRAVSGRLEARLETLRAEGIDNARLAVEAALMADKGDVREEVVRLREHVRACRELISTKVASGKKLDFYGQELLREVNTIGSKSQFATLTQIVVEAKSVVEKFREQVQNIE